MQGAQRVIAIDNVPECLAFAQLAGAEVINFDEVDATILDVIKDITGATVPKSASMPLARPAGFSFVDTETNRILCSFVVFALAFVARPVGSLIFLWIDGKHGRGTNLTIALFTLGGSTSGVAFLSSYDEIGVPVIVMLKTANLNWDRLCAQIHRIGPKLFSTDGDRLG